MNKKPNQDTLFEWYNEALKHSSFLSELSSYQKDKLINYVYEVKIGVIIKSAIECLDRFEDDHYPKDFPLNQRFNYILNTTFINTLKEPIYVLNLLGVNWTPEGSYSSIDKPEQNNIYAIKPIFASNILDDFFCILKEQFEKNEHSALKDLLVNNIIPVNKLYFMNNSNKLADAFKKLIENHLITNCTKAELEKWIVENFTYRNANTKEQTNYKLKTLNDIISSEAKQPCKHPIIKIEDGIIKNP